MIEAYRGYINTDIPSDIRRDEEVPTQPESYLYKRPVDTLMPERKMKRKIVQYEIDFDSTRYKKADKLEGEEKDLYLHKQDEYTTLQIITALGERYNRTLSKINYRIVDGKLYGENMDEPFINVIIRGRDYRKENGSSLHDQMREQAEVDSFLEIQKILTDPNTPKNFLVASYSPPSVSDVESIYRHEFIDLFQKKDDGTVVLWRCSAQTGIEGFISNVEELTGEKIDIPSNDIAIKQRVFKLDPQQTEIWEIGKLHQYFHRHHEVVSDDVFEKIKKGCEQAIKNYKQGLRKDPDDKAGHKLRYNAILVIADKILDSITNDNLEYLRFSDHVMDQNEFYDLGIQESQKVMTACGDSGGGNPSSPFASASALGSYGVSSFGMMGNYTGENAKNDPNLCNCGGWSSHFHCPGTKIEINKETQKKEEVSCSNRIVVGSKTTICMQCGEGKVC